MRKVTIHIFIISFETYPVEVNLIYEKKLLLICNVINKNSINIKLVKCVSKALKKIKMASSEIENVRKRIATQAKKL